MTGSGETTGPNRSRLDARDWLPRIEGVVRRIATRQLDAYRRLDPADVSWKQETNGEPSVVTRWDVESEAQLRDFLQREFPSHSILGEEGGNDKRDPAHYWLLDPIDGTSNFVDGIPFWGTSMAYWMEGSVRLALLYFPALDRMFTAVRDGGAWLDGVQLRTPAVREYSFRGCVALDSRSHLRHVLRLRTRVRILGSAIANLCFTATGAFQASSTRGKLWDLAAGDLLLRESGAITTSSPDLETIDPAPYGLDGPESAPRATLFARSCSELPPLETFLVPLQRP
jgi:myo-inositol-1(or 4)-monophosphatase